MYSYSISNIIPAFILTQPVTMRKAKNVMNFFQFAPIGTDRYGEPGVLKELVVLVRFEAVSLSFIVRDVTIELFEPPLRGCLH